jgi:hypothetical protein
LRYAVVTYRGRDATVSALSDYLETILRERLVDQRRRAKGREAEPGSSASSRDVIGPRALERLAKIPYSTARNLLKGHTKPTEETLKEVADNLGLSYNHLRHLAGMRPATEPFVLPSQAQRLNMRQRRLITNLVLELASENSDEVEPDYSNGGVDGQADVLRFDSKRQRVTEAAWKPGDEE